MLAPDSPGMAHHQKAADGDLKLARGLAAHVGVPDDFDAWWFGTQLMQARAVATGIEHLRSLMELPTLEGIFSQLAVEQDTESMARQMADLIHA